MSKEGEKELESRVTERLLETLGSSTGQDPLRIQRWVSAAVAELLKSKLQPLVKDIVQEPRTRKSFPWRYRGPLEVGVPSPIPGDKCFLLTNEYYTAVYSLTVGWASGPRTELSLKKFHCGQRQDSSPM